MNLNKVFKVWGILAFFTGLLIILYLSHRKTISNYKTVIHRQEQFITSVRDQFIYYIDKNRDISQNNLDTCGFLVKHCLIYRFAEDMCDGCIRQDLEELNSFQQEMGKQYLYILPCYDYKRENDILLSNLLNKFNYRNTSDSIIIFPIHEKTGEFARYIAYIDEDGKISSIFYPIKNKQSLTRLYLSSVKNKFN